MFEYMFFLTIILFCLDIRQEVYKNIEKRQKECLEKVELVVDGANGLYPFGQRNKAHGLLKHVSSYTCCV